MRVNEGRPLILIRCQGGFLLARGGQPEPFLVRRSTR